MLKSIWNISSLIDGSSGTGVFGLIVQPSSMYLTEASEYWIVFIWRGTRVSIVQVLEINFITRTSFQLVVSCFFFLKKETTVEVQGGRKSLGVPFAKRAMADFGWEERNYKKSNGWFWMRREELQKEQWQILDENRGTTKRAMADFG